MTMASSLELRVPFLDKEVFEYSSRIDTLEDKFDANGKVNENLVIANSIADGAVSTNKIANNAVTSNKIADNAVTSNKIADGVITSSKIADGTITSTDIANGTITTSKIADGAITSSKIPDGSISANKLATGILPILKNKKIVCIGDSLTNGNIASNYWPYYLNQMCGATCYNFAVGGQGFVNNASGTFQTQLQNAINSSSFTNDSITDVIVLGGFNDYGAASDALGSAVSTLVNTAKSNFTNANIWVGAMLKGVYPLNYALGGASEAQYRSRYIGTIEYRAKINGASIIEMPWTWCMGEMSWKADNVHVNADGQKYIASCVKNAITGCSTTPFNQTKITSTDVADISEINVLITAYDGTVYIEGHIKMSEALSYQNFLLMPEWAWFSRLDEVNRGVSSIHDGSANAYCYSNGSYIYCHGGGENCNVYIRDSWPMGL